VMGAVPSTHSGMASGINNAVSRTAGLVAIAVLNIVVVLVFSSHYDSGIAALHLPSAAQAMLNAQRKKLAGVSIPASLGPSAHAAVKGAIDQSFVAGFRVAMLISAALAVVSSLAAGMLIEGPGFSPAGLRAPRPAHPTAASTAAPGALNG
jgi:hypothetical protein